jgi:hypothetical protein
LNFLIEVATFANANIAIARTTQGIILINPEHPFGSALLLPIPSLSHVWPIRPCASSSTHHTRTVSDLRFGHIIIMGQIIIVGRR